MGSVGWEWGRWVCGVGWVLPMWVVLGGWVRKPCGGVKRASGGLMEIYAEIYNFLEI